MLPEYILDEQGLHFVRVCKCYSCKTLKDQSRNNSGGIEYDKGKMVQRVGDRNTEYGWPWTVHPPCQPTPPITPGVIKSGVSPDPPEPAKSDGEWVVIDPLLLQRLGPDICVNIYKAEINVEELKKFAAGLEYTVTFYPYPNEEQRRSQVKEDSARLFERYRRKNANN